MVNNAVINTGVQISLRHYFKIFRYMVESRIAGWQFKIFWGIIILFSVSCTLHSQHCTRVHALTNPFDGSHPNEWGGISLWFSFAFPKLLMLQIYYRWRNVQSFFSSIAFVLLYIMWILTPHQLWLAFSPPFPRKVGYLLLLNRSKYIYIYIYLNAFAFYYCMKKSCFSFTIS